MTAPQATDPAGWLDQLQETHEAATKGPWQVDGDGDDLAVTAGTARGLPGSWMATDRIFTSEVGEWSGETEDEGDQRRADAAAIVAEHNAFGELLRLAREREAVVRAVLAKCDAMETEANERDAIADRLPSAASYHMEVNRLVVAAAHQRRAAKQIRSAVTAALGAIGGETPAEGHCGDCGTTWRGPGPLPTVCPTCVGGEK